MLTLLVLTDFSPVADHALQYAAALAAPAGAHLVLLHVRPSLLSPRAFTAAADYSESQANDLLQQRLRTLPAAVRATCALERGDVGTELATAARRHKASVIVVGRPDLSNTPEELAHTTSLEVLRHVACPLLIVPHNASGTVPPRQVLLAIDDQPLPTTHATQTLQPLLGSAALTVLHVSDEEVTNDPTRAFANAQHAGLTAGFASAQPNGFSGASPAAGIADAAAMLQPDLLLLVARRRSFLGQLFHESVTAAVVREARLPVLVLPEVA
ncbi:universal stress protein [Hymenobacter latericus]|uniref:universal stress protein n=1 Tax=Hymenobacter sp. YIM 151858-1 TaxID=2987688 RepID=UPI002227094E|nr:universal stress protein [Hymenobacter sp. YIM 151858-1]UYZ60850.1 universal stress protein [Hymenobacter sp. YIM 151858-1]